MHVLWQSQSEERFPTILQGGMHDEYQRSEQKRPWLKKHGATKEGNTSNRETCRISWYWLQHQPPLPARNALRIEETARNKQRVRVKMSERMRRVDEGKTAKSNWDLLGSGQTRVVGVKEGGQERDRNPRTITRPWRKMKNTLSWYLSHLTNTRWWKTRLLGCETMVLRSLSWQCLRLEYRRSRRLFVRKLWNPLWKERVLGVGGMVLHPLTSCLRVPVEHKRLGKVCVKSRPVSSVQAPAVQVVPVQTKPICGEMEREGERDGCAHVQQRMLVFWIWIRVARSWSEFLGHSCPGETVSCEGCWREWWPCRARVGQRMCGPSMRLDHRQEKPWQMDKWDDGWYCTVPKNCMNSRKGIRQHRSRQNSDDTPMLQWLWGMAPGRRSRTATLNIFRWVDIVRYRSERQCNELTKDVDRIALTA